MKSLQAIFLIATIIGGFALAGLAQNASADQIFKISGYIQDSNGNGIAGANIIFNVPDTVPSVHSNSQGYYQISAPPGTYHLNIWPPFDTNYISYDEPTFTVTSDTTKNITLTSGYKVSGYVTDATGNPVVGASVIFRNPTTPPGWFGSGWFTTSAGYYFLSAPSGTYTIDAHPRTGNYYTGTTTPFPAYTEYDFPVNSDIVKNITVGNTPTPPTTNTLQVELQTKNDGQAQFTREKVHTSLNSAKLVIPQNSTVGSYAMALYPYNKPLNTVSSFSIYTSYVNAVPRFVILLDTNTDGQADLTLLSDYQAPSDGTWQDTTGGSRWGWTQANTQLSIYGQTWNTLDYWKTQYGNATALYVGIALEYWAVDPSGYGEALYADELTINGVKYNIEPAVNNTDNYNSDWTMFHNDLAHSGSIEATGPLTNQVLWKFQVGSSIESSPSVAGGVVYFGALWNGNNGFVYAVNATTGVKIWQFATDSGVESSPTIVDGVVYVGTWGGHVYALNAANGAIVWSFNAGGPVFPSPAYVDGVIYVGSGSGNLYALNASNGSPLWSYHTGGTILSSAAVVDGVVYFGSEDNNMYALNASDGSEIWRYTTGNYIDSSPVVVGDQVYFGSRDGYVYALNAADGSEIWSFRPAHGNYGSYCYSTPAAANGVVYVGGYDSYVYALNATTGSVLWQHRTGGYIFSSPIVAGGVLYVGSYDGNVYALNAATGSEIWSYQTGNHIRSSCAVANGAVYVGSDAGYLYAFGSSSDTQLASQATTMSTAAPSSPEATESTSSGTTAASEMQQKTAPANTAPDQISNSTDTETPSQEGPAVNVNKTIPSETPLWGWIVTAIAVSIIGTVVGTGFVTVWRISKRTKKYTNSSQSSNQVGSGGRDE